MEAIAASLITAVVGVIGGYVVGNYRLKYEHLHERRAGVIAKLCELLAAVQRGVVAFAHFYQSGDVDRREQAQEANQAFKELVDYYRANEVWLEPGTCEKVETFMDNVYLPLGEYFDDLDERGYPKTAKGRALSGQIVQEVQPLRRELISEFRAILYPPPWYDAPLRFLEWLQPPRRGDSS
jgi:hypothetical protein